MSEKVEKMNTQIKVHESSQPFNMFILLNDRYAVFIERLFFWLMHLNGENLLSNSFWNGFKCSTNTNHSESLLRFNEDESN